MPNEESSQSVPQEVQNNNSNEDENPLWHVEEQKFTSENDKMIVPKLTLKIPKAFQKQHFDNIDSDEDSGDEDEDSNNESVSGNSNIDKSKRNENNKNLSNSLNEYSSSLSDSHNDDSQIKKQKDHQESMETIQQKRPENMPCLKLKIKNLTSNPESVLENFDYSTSISTVFKPETEDMPSRDEERQDVDMSEMPMDIEPSTDVNDTLNNECKTDSECEKLEPKKLIIDGNLIIPANDDILPIHIRLDESLDKIPILKLMKICLHDAFQFCLYCNHARKIVVNGKGLALHFITHHRFHALVDSITAEELHPEKFVFKFEQSIDELSTCFFNLDTYDDHDTEKKEGHVTISHEKLYECFQCRFQTPIHKELYLHNRKMHQKSLINCLMCKMGFYSYSELLCHICPGIPNKQTFNDYKFYCCLCNMDNIPSAFRLMVHLRKKHYACDVCLEKCSDQSKLSSHVWKHKLLHICYRCHIFYQNKADIMKHLFWKHGTEGIECKKCLQKKWPHVYHFCIPPATFTCPHCEMQFSRAITLKVHIRLHEDGAKYACTEIDCEKKFISKKLLIRHLERHQSELNAKENGDQARTEGSVIIPHEIPNGFCTRTIPVVFKRFIKKPAIRKIETEPKVVEPVKIESNITTKKEDENKDAKSLLDLPETGNLNLSESSEESSNEESSDDHDNSEKKTKNKKQSKIVIPVQQQNTEITSKKNNNIDESLTQQIETANDPSALLNNKISTLSDSDDDDDECKQKIELKEIDGNQLSSDGKESMQNILDNLKNFKEHNEVKQEKSNENEKSEPNTTTTTTTTKNKTEVQTESAIDEEFKDSLPDKIKLHVCMSDHDYAQLYRTPVESATNDDLEDVIKSATIDRKDNKKNDKSISKNKGEKSTKKNDDFSSSDSSSDSSSNSSNSSTSSSSSSSTSDSSSSEASSTNTNRPRNKKYTKKRSKKEKKNQTGTEEVELPRDPDDIIYESDLLTDETNTDEDFYDEHPLKMSSEKRKQLGDIDGIIENSRPSTPSLPPDEKIEKRIKIKKRKRDHKKSISSPTKRTQREQNSSFINQDDDSTSFSINSHLNQSLIHPPDTPQNFRISSRLSQGYMHTSTPISAPPRIELHQANQIRQLLQSTQQQPVLPILKEQHHHYHFQQKNDQSNNEYINVSRVSSAQSSRMNSDNEQSGIKRSQRRRIPNKFYGYTSDDNNLASQSVPNDPFKPIPPPNLTWNKEDLPSRSKSPNPLQQQRVAPIKLNLNNNDSMQQPPQIFDTFESSVAQQQLPINNIYNVNNNNNNNNKSNEIIGYNYSESESSGDQLHISEPKKRKRKLPSQNMYAFHTLETPPTTAQPNLPPIPRLKLTIGSNNKIRRRNINPLKPPPKKRRKIPPKSTDTSFKDSSLKVSNLTPTVSKPFVKQQSTKNLVDQNDISKNSQKVLAEEKKQKLEEAIISTQQYFQRYNHTQLTSSDTPQDQVDNDGRVYCYCRRPYDDLQGMIGCDGPSCQIEWFHFECVGILVPPKGNWFCPQCQNQQHQPTF